MGLILISICILIIFSVVAAVRWGNSKRFQAGIHTFSSITLSLFTIVLAITTIYYANTSRTLLLQNYEPCLDITPQKVSIENKTLLVTIANCGEIDIRELRMRNTFFEVNARDGPVELGPYEIGPSEMIAPILKAGAKMQMQIRVPGELKLVGSSSHYPGYLLSKATFKHRLSGHLKEEQYEFIPVDKKGQIEFIRAEGYLKLINAIYRARYKKQ